MTAPLRTVVRFLIPAWATPTARPQAPQLRRDAIAAGAGVDAQWERVRSQITGRGLVLAAAGPEDNATVQGLLPSVGRWLAAMHDGCSITVQHEPVSAAPTPAALWAYRIQRLVVAKPAVASKQWEAERSQLAGHPPDSWEVATATRLTAALRRDAAEWGIDLPDAGAPLLTVLDAGRAMPVPALPTGAHVLARLGVLVASPVRISGLLAAGKLARLGFGWLEPAYLPAEIQPAAARRLAMRMLDTEDAS